MVIPPKERSDQTKELIKTVFENQLPNHGYRLCYGYHLEHYFLSKKMYNYAIGFNNKTGALAIIPLLDGGSKASPVMKLAENDIIMAKINAKGKVKLRTRKLRRQIVFTVSDYTPPKMMRYFALPIVQEDVAYEFMAFTRKHF